jgi:hypothetical protein
MAVCCKARPQRSEAKQGPAGTRRRYVPGVKGRLERASQGRYYSVNFLHMYAYLLCLYVYVWLSDPGIDQQAWLSSQRGMGRRAQEGATLRGGGSVCTANGCWLFWCLMMVLVAACRELRRPSERWTLWGADAVRGVRQLGEVARTSPPVAACTTLARHHDGS